MAGDEIIRVRLTVRGVVQGVGFRPFVYKAAVANRLTGSVRNTGEGVVIEAQGPGGSVRAFVTALERQKPSQARIDSYVCSRIVPLRENAFVIERSFGRSASALIPADLSICPDCAREMSDPLDRRHEYPFTNCTNCGPRFTIVQELPYDRPNTTMSGFPMCPDCRAEYENPLDRRFHAQPNACPICGPQVFAIRNGKKLKGRAALLAAALFIEKGGIVALKSLGGYHLACAADNDSAVRRLRKAKQRPAKPFAVMFQSLGHVRRRCLVTSAETALLSSPCAPIVMLDKKKSGDFALCAPDLARVGVMLPYTPLHLVLFRMLGELGFDGPLVMTSGNLKDEPICLEEKQARKKLGAFSGLIVSHDRPIHNRCDDSVLFVGDGEPRFIRRARGYVPQSIPLKMAGPQTLACGAELKNTFCLARGTEAFLSQHIGDLDDVENSAFYLETLRNMKKLLGVRPELVAHDLHPDYISTRLARKLPGRKIAVQHHFAHIASVMAEHGLDEPVLGAALDGTGYGTDGTIWGCEFMLAEGGKWTRLGSLKPTPLPGGDSAVLDIWKMGLSWLLTACGGDWRRHEKLFAGIKRGDLETVEKMCASNVNSPKCSSMGRLFDAVAFFAGLGPTVSFEAQAAMELEARYKPVRISDAYRFDFSEHDGLLLADPAPLVKAAAADRNAARISAGLHRATAAMTVEMLCRLSKKTGIKKAALSGGVFQNRVLLELVAEGLRGKGLRPHFNRLVPANDGGLSLGQCWAARQSVR